MNNELRPPDNESRPLAVPVVDDMDGEPVAGAQGPAYHAAPSPDEDARLASDAALIERALAGDRPAFEVLVRRHYRGVFAVAFAILGNRWDAEDVCHDAFVHAARALRDCRHPDRFVHWLHVIARNTARNARSRRAVREVVPLDHETAASGHDVAQSMAHDELRVRLERAIAQLSPVRRQVLLLHDLHGCTHDEIARSVGTSALMSRQHLFKARRTLRTLLGPHMHEEYFNDE
jgi:RNA polymerase sigma-70 factor (ECF subfamily)